MTTPTKIKLKTIGTVRSGLVLSRKTAKKSNGYRYLQLNLRSITEDGYIDSDQLEVYDAIEQLYHDYLTQPGDIIIRLSSPYTAVLIDEDHTDLVISSNFALVRVDQKKILPGYLVWLLNTAQVKHKIFVNSSSNMLGAIKPSFFANYELILPPMDHQSIIADLNKLARREKHLLKQLATNKNSFYDHVLNSSHQGILKELSNDDKR